MSTCQAPAREGFTPKSQENEIMQVIPATGTRQLAVKVPSALLEQIDAAALFHGVTRAVIVREALRHGLQLGPRPGFATVPKIEHGDPTGQPVTP
jgi:Ribbon-helix-helix protein, copG family